MDKVFWGYTIRVSLPRQSVDTHRRPEEHPMLTTATSEVLRLLSTVVRRIDAGLVQSAVRNAEASVLAAHRRWLDEMATLSDLYAIEGLVGAVESVAAAPEALPAVPEALPAVPEAAVPEALPAISEALPAPQIPALAVV
jgi:hypothetical protein